MYVKYVHVLQWIALCSVDLFGSVVERGCEFYELTPEKSNQSGQGLSV